ncbi:MAG: CotH kinase family protein, partial [Verrucomicrobia bacterium]|nr:CotH kinase family protein [Verrucomicrobiota bacterium]
RADLVISEFLASSSSDGFLDEDGKSSDWIEIHNNGETAVDLAGYYLTDDPANLDLWRFPSRRLEGGAYHLVVFASGNDRTEDEGELHSNFRLNAAGDFLGLVAPDGTTIVHSYNPAFPEQFENESFGLALPANLQATTLIASGTDAKWSVPTETIADWAAADYDDSGWQAGKTGIGFGYDGLVGVGGDVEAAMRTINATAYVRVPFQVENPFAVVTMTLRLKYEDGFVAFLNGEPIAGANDPADLAWNSQSTASNADAKAEVFEDFPVDFAGKIVAGTNVLAIQIMNSSAGGSDLIVLPELVAELRDVNQELVPGYLLTTTPGAPNASGIAPGPLISEVTENPEQPDGGVDLPITAKVIEIDGGGVAGVQLVYSLMYEDEVTVPMLDDGAGPDGKAADGVYSATIPASVVQPGKMIRWKVLATDGIGNESKSPAYRDSVNSHQWLGTVPKDPSIRTNLTVLHWFIETPSRAQSTTRDNASMYYLGQFYDNVESDLHGQSTSGGNFVKKSFNVDFPETQRFRWKEGEKRVRDIKLLTNWADKAKMRHPLAYEVLREAGVAAHFAFTVRVQQNGEFYSIQDIIEDPDDTYLDRAGLNPNGALYKMYNTFNNTGEARATVNEKKTRKSESRDDIVEMYAGISLREAAAKRAYIMDNVDIPKTVNYLATNLLLSNTDCCHKNYYLYRDSDQTGEWAMLPWDLDLAWGRQWNGTDNYFDDKLFADRPIILGTNNGFVKAALAAPGVRDMVKRRIRTVSDQFIQPPGTPVEERWLERRMDEILAEIDPDDIEPSDADLDWEKWGTWTNPPYRRLVGATLETADEKHTMRGAIQRIKDEYAEQRRVYVYDRNTGNRGEKIPEAQAGFVSVAFEPLVSAGETKSILVPADGSLGDTWTAADFTPVGWTSGVNGVGYEGGTGYETLIGIELDRPNLTSDSVYMRMPFTLADVGNVTKLELRMKYDDGFVAFLNGVKIAAANAPDAPSWDSAATSSHSDSEAVEFVAFDVSQFVSLLKVGANVLAVQGLNSPSGASPGGGSDFLILPELHGGFAGAAAAQPKIDFGKVEFEPVSGNQDEEYIELINNNEIAVDISEWKLEGGVDFAFEPGTVIPAGWTLYVSPNVNAFRARTASPKGGEQLFIEGNYKGHLSNFPETITLVDHAGATIGSTTYEGNPSDHQRYLVISELMYNPKADRGSEFIEIRNISDAVTLDLTGVKLSGGVIFDFTGSNVTSLAPGGVVLVVRKLVGFRAVYGNDLNAIIAGEFADGSALSNGGERLKLEDPGNYTNTQVDYDDADPWPKGADGEGASIELVNFSSRPDPNASANWVTSTNPNGTPGAGAVIPDGFTGDPNVDVDGDTLSRFLEYSLGTSDLDAASGLDAISTGIDVSGKVTFSFQRNKAASDVTFAVEVSDALGNWSDGTAVLDLAGTADLGGNVENVTYRTKSAATGQMFFRLRVTKR